MIRARPIAPEEAAALAAAWADATPAQCAAAAELLRAMGASVAAAAGEPAHILRPALEAVAASYCDVADRIEAQSEKEPDA